MRLIQSLCAVMWQQFRRLNHSVYSAALRGGCCSPPCAVDVVLWLRGLTFIEISEDYYYYYYYYHIIPPLPMLSSSYHRKYQILYITDYILDTRVQSVFVVLITIARILQTAIIVVRCFPISCFPSNTHQHISIYVLHVGAAVGRWPCDWRVAGSNPSQSAFT